MVFISPALTNIYMFHILISKTIIFIKLVGEEICLQE